MCFQEQQSDEQMQRYKFRSLSYTGSSGRQDKKEQKELGHHFELYVAHTSAPRYSNSCQTTIMYCTCVKHEDGVCSEAIRTRIIFKV